LPNLYVNADGSATVELYSTLVTLSGGDNRPELLDADGSALVIHANPMTANHSRSEEPAQRLRVLQVQ
jgi:Cu/Zn superoxide dismutase